MSTSPPSKPQKVSRSSLIAGIAEQMSGCGIACTSD
jgi:hypothetical protein